MKKVVLVFATALTLFSCKKETVVSNEGKTCNCYTESQNKNYSYVWTEASPNYNPNEQLSVSYGSSIITDEEKDFSPIFMAVQKLSTELLELMCDHGVSLTVKNSMGMTPLMFAAENNL